MHRKRGADINLADVLAKLRGEKPPKPVPVVYSASDIVAAKSVLDRLLLATTKNEVSYIREIPTENNEPEEET